MNAIRKIIGSVMMLMGVVLLGLAASPAYAQMDMGGMGMNDPEDEAIEIATNLPELQEQLSQIEGWQAEAWQGEENGNIWEVEFFV
ncbi:MAG: hypothetical protein AAF125_07595, partial [Chloroflexota bacterium]